MTRSSRATRIAIASIASCGCDSSGSRPTRPVVVCLDDVHWADPGSIEALAALVHRPPAGPALLALASRSGQAPAVLVRALAAAGPVRLSPGPLDEAEARALVGEAAAAVYADSGGNPFYLEQLARGRAAAATTGGDGSAPPAVAAVLAAEIAALPDEARRLIDAAAVAGDPFEVGIAAEVAALDEAAALDALDVLLAQALVRPGGAPRRFAFRHPVVRHAVYEAVPAGRRIGAHGRAADALARRGAGPVQRAHHVEQAAGPGDAEAIALLDAAAAELRSLAPGTAAHLLSAVLRLLPHGRPRTRFEMRLADAQAAAGDAAGSRDTLLEALRTRRAGGSVAPHRRRGERGVVDRAHGGRAAAAARRARVAPRAAVTRSHPAAARARPDGADELRPRRRRAARRAMPGTTRARSAIPSSRRRRSPAARWRGWRRPRHPRAPVGWRRRPWRSSG